MLGYFWIHRFRAKPMVTLWRYRLFEGCCPLINQELLSTSVKEKNPNKTEHHHKTHPTLQDPSQNSPSCKKNSSVQGWASAIMEQTTAALFAFRATAAIFNSLLQTEVSESQNKDNSVLNRKKIKFLDLSKHRSRRLKIYFPSTREACCSSTECLNAESSN